MKKPGLLAALVALVAAAGCATFAPGALPPGTPISEARSVLGGPTGEFPLADGGTRLEFSRGAFGRQAWMLDFDAGGRLVHTEQVLDPDHFATIAIGMTADDVRIRLGRPSHVFNVGWQKLTVWNYRWWQGDCVWYQVSISQETGRVAEAGYGSDPACDVAGGPKS
jgi:hypothetical protein